MSAGPGPATVEALWRELHGRVDGFVRRRVPASDVDDVVQDVFLRLTVGLGGRRLENPSAFVHQVARNAIVDHHRRRLPTEPEVEVVVPMPDDDEVRELLTACVRPFVDELPEPYREAVRLTDLEGLSQAEAARRLGLSASGMRTRVQRGRDKLRDRFDACCRFELDRRGGVVTAEPRDCGGCSPPADPACRSDQGLAHR